MKRIINIKHPSDLAKAKARERVDSLVKPIGSLGLLEDYAVKLAGIFGKWNIPALKKAVAVFAADNGVWEEGITPVPQSVTAMQAINMTKGLTGINVFASSAGADVFVYDMGIKGFEGGKGIENRRIGDGTHSIAKGAAMDIGQAVQAIAHGIDAAESLWGKGYRVVGCGEMGICNTTTSAAVVSVLTDTEPCKVVGRGAGISDEQLEKKTSVVARAIEVNHPDKNNVLDVLSKLGGYDIAAMTGFFIGAAYKQMAVVVDGFISATAALAASRMNPLVTGYMFASHQSTEPGFETVMDALGLDAPLALQMRLGEGSGCPLMFHLLDASIAMMQNMGTFAEAKIDASKLVDIRG
ncbi:MAG: nicotinate-nucleotide--dimethylbenzimidazole phosphoribosyltransferase [Eubacteriales bacterium]|nr:nicotinate-nucleotide--dimethylbenzimidazole phosphoribosyltransferase [Eubacteriales bacterium]